MRNPSGDAGGIGYEEELSPTLLADRPPGVAVPLTFSQIGYAKYKAEEVAPTLKAAGGDYGGGSELLILQSVLTATTGNSQEGEQ